MPPCAHHFPSLYCVRKESGRLQHAVTCPEDNTSCNGVRPSVAAVASAPCSTRICTTSIFPQSDASATCGGVRPLSARTVGSVHEAAYDVHIVATCNGDNLPLTRDFAYALCPEIILTNLLEGREVTPKKRKKSSGPRPVSTLGADPVRTYNSSLNSS